MKKRGLSFSELLRINKAELLMDKVKLEKIEKRMDEKFVESYNEMLHQTKK